MVLMGRAATMVVASTIISNSRASLEAVEAAVIIRIAATTTTALAVSEGG